MEFPNNNSTTSSGSSSSSHHQSATAQSGTTFSAAQHNALFGLFNNLMASGGGLAAGPGRRKKEREAVKRARPQDDNSLNAMKSGGRLLALFRKQIGKTEAEVKKKREKAEELLFEAQLGDLALQQQQVSTTTDSILAALLQAGSDLAHPPLDEETDSKEEKKQRARPRRAAASRPVARPASEDVAMPAAEPEPERIPPSIRNITEGWKIEFTAEFVKERKERYPDNIGAISCAGMCNGPDASDSLFQVGEYVAFPRQQQGDCFHLAHTHCAAKLLHLASLRGEGQHQLAQCPQCSQAWANFDAPPSHRIPRATTARSPPSSSSSSSSSSS